MNRRTILDVAYQGALLAREQATSGEHSEMTRYRNAYAEVLGRGERPTDERVAAVLGVSAKTISRWRSRGLLD